MNQSRPAWDLGQILPWVSLSVNPAVKSITAPWLVPIYTVCWKAHMCKQLAQGYYVVVPGQDSNPRPVNRKSDGLAIAPARQAVSVIDRQ